MVLINRSEGNLNAETYQKQRMSSAVPSTTIYRMRYMNYQKIYTSLVENRRSFPPEKPYDFHHIIPRCLGGGDESENLVRLTYREHIHAHLLLAKIYSTNKKVLFAATAMTSTFRSSKKCAWLRKLHTQTPISEETRKKISMIVRNRTEETRKKQSLALIARWNGTELREQVSEKRRGIPLSEDHKKNLSLNHVGMRNKHHTEATKTKIAETQKLVNLSDEVRKKKSEGMKRVWADRRKK